MENNTSTIEMLFDKAKDYGVTTAKLYKLQAVDKGADIVSSIVSQIAISIVLVFFVLLINIALSLWIGDELGKAYYGFFVMSGFYFLLGLVLYFFKDQLIKTPISNLIITKILKK